MKTKTPRRFQSGFTLVEIMIVVAILGLLVSLALPNFIKSRTNAQKQVCIENLAQIESAKQIWGIENGKHDGDEVSVDDLVGPTLYIKRQPECPGGGTYAYATIGENATCSQEDHVLD